LQKEIGGLRNETRNQEKNIYDYKLSYHYAVIFVGKLVNSGMDGFAYAQTCSKDLL